MYYGSPFYIAMILLLLFVCFLLWFFIRRLSPRMQRVAVFTIMIINVLQHLFKWAIYPIYDGYSFNALSTAYNVCALLILAMPIALLSKSKALREYVFLAGALAGLVTNIVPFWHIGIPVSELGWEYARFYICHSLLFYSGMLPLLLGMHKVSYRRSPLVALGFLFSICVILINDIVCIALGIYGSFTLDGLYDALVEMNPAMCMKPNASFPILDKIVSKMSPSAFLPSGNDGVYVPILWYAIPVFLGVTLLSFVVAALVNRKEFLSDMRKLKELLIKGKNKILGLFSK